ncbi:MAG: hypothetical protein Q7R78_00625 [bacterium]|nr:hypothetical protein [bacterium]
MFFLKRKNKGIIIVTALIYGSISAIIIAGLVTWFAGLMNASRVLLDRERAFQIAESGIDYYRWHLAHAPQDFKDGTGNTGPYIHDYFDKDGNKIGQYSLNITAPDVGSTIVIVESTGQVSSNPNVYRKIRAKLAIPSLAKFAVLTNEANRFGEGTVVYGPIHSNGGIRFDGIAYGVISSTKASYDDPDHIGAVEFGVHTHVKNLPATGVLDTFRADEAPPSVIKDRSDVFKAGRQFPVPSFDFAGITTDLADVKTKAQSAGKYFTPSGSLGYHVVFKTNDTFDLYKVTSFITVNGACNKNENNQDGWGLWSIKTEQFLANHPNPSNGLLFFEDNVWVNGQINTARVTLVAAKYPDNASERKNIIINNDLLYTNKDGRDVIGLIAQNNISVGMVSEDNLEIDAALVAQNGRIGRFYYKTSQCITYQFRDTITLYGMIASNQRYGFAYTDGNGYINRYITFDANLLYNPPPNFPLTSNQYVTLSWDEIK